MFVIGVIVHMFMFVNKLPNCDDIEGVLYEK